MARYNRIKKKSDLKKPDQFVSFWEHAYIWLNENRERILIPGLAVIVAVMLAGGYLYYRSQREISAQRELYFALKDLPGEVSGRKSVLKELLEPLDEISERFSGSVGARIAEIYIGNEHYDKGRMEKAEPIFKSIAESGGSRNVISRLAALGLARVYQNRGKYDDSTKVLEKFRKAENSAFGEEMDLLVAENHELSGDSNAAMKDYADFLKKYPGSIRAMRVRDKAEALKRG